jgi:hypothetical protein
MLDRATVCSETVVITPAKAPTPIQPKIFRVCRMCFTYEQVSMLTPPAQACRVQALPCEATAAAAWATAWASPR